MWQCVVTCSVDLHASTLMWLALHCRIRFNFSHVRIYQEDILFSIIMCVDGLLREIIFLCFVVVLRCLYEIKLGLRFTRVGVWEREHRVKAIVYDVEQCR